MCDGLFVCKCVMESLLMNVLSVGLCVSFEMSEDGDWDGFDWGGEEIWKFGVCNVVVMMELFELKGDKCEVRLWDGRLMCLIVLSVENDGL